MSSASADGLFADLSNRVSLEDSLIFPTEIFQTILWQLRDDIPTLRVCSLVSKPFSQLSQRLLFREIVLEDRPPKTPPAPSVRSSSSSIRSSFSGRKTPSERLHRLFSNSPHLAKYARSLTLQCGSGSKGDSWIMSDDFLHLIVPLMNRLDRFTFTSTARGKRALDFVRLPLSVREALVEVLQLPGIKALSIEGLEHIPIPVFNACTMVERLTLAFYSLSDGTKREFSDLLLPPTPSTGRLCRLRTLGLHHCSKHHLRTLQWLAHAHCPFNLNKIKKLEYSSEDDEHEACFKALLKGMPWTLQSLSYTPPLHGASSFSLTQYDSKWRPQLPPSSPCVVVTIRGAPTSPMLAWRGSLSCDPLSLVSTFARRLSIHQMVPLVHLLHSQATPTRCPFWFAFFKLSPPPTGFAR